MKKLNIKKVLGETPENVFDAIKLMIKAQQEVLEAIHIMKSITADVDAYKDYIPRINQFLDKFYD
jgi:hypothetical protein